MVPAVRDVYKRQDHKRAYDGDAGPNTGGMGAFSPSRFYTEEIAAVCMETIFQPTVAAMAKEGRPFKGHCLPIPGLPIPSQYHRHAALLSDSSVLHR